MTQAYFRRFILQPREQRKYSLRIIPFELILRKKNAELVTNRDSLIPFQKEFHGH